MHRALTVVGLVMILLCSSALAGGVDNSLYGNVLEKYVKDGLVDYASIKAHPENLDDYLTMMGRVNVRELKRTDRLAYYINLYNAATIRLVVTKYPVDSIKEIGSIFKSPWKMKTVLLDGKMVSLDHIEHDIIRPEFQDPRVHFALNCSAMSCPPLLGEPYEGDMLDMQLDLAVEMFINNSRYNYLKEDTFYISRIFDWYSGDFPEELVPWISGYARGNLQRQLEDLIRGGKRVKVRYLKYDWSLNRQGR